MSQIIKHVNGTVVQTFDSETGKCISQSFHATGTAVEVDGVLQEATDQAFGEFEKFKQPVELVQPPNPRIAKVMLINSTDSVKDEALRSELENSGDVVLLDIGPPYRIEAMKAVSAELSAAMAEGMMNDCNFVLLF